MDTTLEAAVRVALRENEIGNRTPYELSYARLGDSGGSFGVFQGDAHTDGEARNALKTILNVSKVDQVTADRIIDAVSKPCPDGSPLSAEEQKTVDDALASEAGRTLVDAMDEKIFKRVLGQLATSLDAAASAQRKLDSGAQISIALWVNMTGEPTDLNRWITSTPVKDVQTPAWPVITRADIKQYLEVTKYFREHPKNLVHFEDSVDVGLGKLPGLSINELSATTGIVHSSPDHATTETAPDGKGSTGDAPDDAMLGYFLSTLTVRALQVRLTVADDPARAVLLAELESSLAAFCSRFKASAAPANHTAWTEAYRLERVLALAEPPSNLVSEIKRQTAEAVDEGIPAAARLVAAFEAALPMAIDTSQSPPALRQGGDRILRPLLIQTLEELHWNSQRKFYARPIQKSATYRIVYLGVAAFILFLAPYLIIYCALFFKEHKPALATWSGLPLYTALTAGLFGAFFSRLLYLQQNWNSFTLGAIMDARDFTSILLRGCVGMTGATIVYFFLQSGAMSGALFPNFAQIGFEQVAHPTNPAANVIPIQLFFPNPALALLVVWCFLAGFSERLVPSILESTEISLGNQGQPK